MSLFIYLSNIPTIYSCFPLNGSAFLPVSTFPDCFWSSPPSSSSSPSWCEVMLCSCVCLFSVQDPLNQIYVVADVTSVHRAKRHQSALRLAQGEEALPSRVTEDYCTNDHLCFILCLNILTRRVQCMLPVLPSVIYVRNSVQGLKKGRKLSLK